MKEKGVLSLRTSVVYFPHQLRSQLSIVATDKAGEEAGVGMNLSWILRGMRILQKNQGD